MGKLVLLAQNIIIGERDVLNFRGEITNYTYKNIISKNKSGITNNVDFINFYLINRREKEGPYYEFLNEHELSGWYSGSVISQTDGWPSKFNFVKSNIKARNGKNLEPLLEYNNKSSALYTEKPKTFKIDDYFKVDEKNKNYEYKPIGENYLYDEYIKKNPYGKNTYENFFRHYYTVKDDYQISDNIKYDQLNYILGRHTKNNHTLNYYKESGGTIANANNVVDNLTIENINELSGNISLVKKTAELFNKGKINTLINRFHTTEKFDEKNDSELINSYDKNFGLSRGRNLIKKEYEGESNGDSTTGYDNPYCRVWTAHYQYSKLKDRIRPFVNDKGESISIGDTQSNYGALRPNDGHIRLNDNSVLRSDGYLRITPTHENSQYTDIKNYMFSIENLAWKDVLLRDDNGLSKEQKGPNDGRIMWFPPYNLKFTENVNVNWNANTFIGRGEEIYTYTNTVRSGTLDFTILIDHPSILNKWVSTVEDSDKETKELDLLRYFAGCGNLNESVTPRVDNPNDDEDEDGDDNLRPNKKGMQLAFVLFFPNNYTGIDTIKTSDSKHFAIDMLNAYNNGETVDVVDIEYKNHKHLDSANTYSVGFKPIDYKDQIKTNLNLTGIDDKNLFFFDFPKGEELTKYFNVTSYEAKGFASSHGYENYNINLCKRREDVITEIMKIYGYNLNNYKTYSENNKTNNIIQVNNEIPKVNDLEAKLARVAYIILNLEPKSDISLNSSQNGYWGKYYQENSSGNKNTNIVSIVSEGEKEYTYDNEYLYFSEIRKDSIIHKNIIDKVKYFDPVYHSITPEGFNSRLTFLHQCTRQGPTNAVTSGLVNDKSPDYLKFAGNLSFGRAPYCILRIGDFFNTKICIDSLSINYDNNGIQWDLNPEGVGVQPMFANISISFKFLGGQDISGPIERLQNAVTANYYANTSVYSRHSDTKEFYYDAMTNQKINK